MKNDPAAYGTLIELEAGFSKLLTGTEIQSLSNLLKKVKAEPPREVDIALIPSASESNQLFHKVFSANFVVIEDNPLEPIQGNTFSALAKTFHPNLSKNTIEGSIHALILCSSSQKCTHSQTPGPSASICNATRPFLYHVQYIICPYFSSISISSSPGAASP
jgi:hypothetical protein